MLKISKIFVVLIVLFCASSSFAANFVYNLDVEIPDPEAIAETDNRIGMIEFIVSGSSSYDYSLGSTVPLKGNWIFERFGEYASLYDDFSSLNGLAPLTSSGRLLTITSDTELFFSDLEFVDYEGNVVDNSNGYFLTSGFVHDQSPVPVPAAGWIMISGLAGLVSLRCRKK